MASERTTATTFGGVAGAAYCQFGGEEPAACKPVDTLGRAQALGGREIRERLSLNAVRAAFEGVAGKDEKLIGGGFSTGTQERVGGHWYLRARTNETAYLVVVSAATCEVGVVTCREAGGAGGACYETPTPERAAALAKKILKS